MNRSARLMGRRWLGLLGLMVAGLVWASPAEEPATRTLTIQLDPATRALQGELRQRLPAGGSFRLLEGLTITAARRGDAPLTLAQADDGRWQLPPGGDIPVTLRWQGTLPEATARDLHRVATDGTLLPTRAGWYPHLSDTPTPLQLTIRVPPGQRAVGSGSLQEEQQLDDGYLARYYHPRTRDLEIAAGPWRLRERELEGVRLRTLFPKGLDAAFAETYLAHAADTLALFQDRLGELPYSSFSIAASPAPVGLAFPGFTLLGERVIPLPFIPRSSLPHELMHAWWGAGVGIDYSSGNWSEALTTYLADHALAEQAGEAETMRRRWLADLAALPAGQESPLVAFRGGPDPAGRLIGYQHGAMLFHMLRQRIGDEAFDRGLRHMADEWMHRTADWSTLIDAFSQAAGEPQGAFLMPWLTRPSRPSLHLEAVRIETDARGDTLTGELVQRGPHAPWPMAVPLVVETEEGRVRLVQHMDNERQEFELRLASPPLALEVDPEADLLRHPGAMPVILRQLMLDPTTRVLALNDAYRPLTRQVLGREADAPATPVGFTDETGEPLLVIGSTAALGEWRRANDLPAPPRPLETAGQARFWMVPGRPLGLLSGDDADAVARLAASLRHHGQRSYVVQGPGGDTQESGIWEVDETPLRTTFTH